MANPNLTQTLQNLAENFPGAVSTSAPAPTQAVGAEIAALIRSPLAIGDKLATEATQATIRAAEIASETKGGAPNATNRRLLTEAEMKAAVFSNLPLLNGFTAARVECRVAENDVSILIEDLVGSGTPMGGLKLCDIPVSSEFTYGLSATGISANKIAVHTSGAALYLGTLGTLTAPNLITLSSKRN
jgi:hypothetical protein